MQVLHDSAAWLAYRREHGEGAFVPTMGALHAGHAALIRDASSRALRQGLPGGAVVSIFVNPTQFNDPKDYSRYPRTLEADLALCQASGCSAVFAPSEADIYPPGRPPRVPPLPAVARTPGLEDAHRPGHFAGVCQIVLRLFELVDPAVAVFGEKDWQQLQVVRSMVEAERLRVRVEGLATIREADGLAMSSRNRFLTPEDRVRALAISRALREARQAPTPDEAEGVLRRVLGEASIVPEYAVVREASSLQRPAAGAKVHTQRWRALIAAGVGNVRLIDNDAWEPPRPNTG